MKNITKDYFYSSKLKNKKTKQFRCRIQHNGKRSIHYFNSQKEVDQFRQKLKNERGFCYKKGDIEYHSLFYIWNEWFNFKKIELSAPTQYQYKQAFKKVLFRFKDSWFHLITESDGLSVLIENPDNKNNSSFYYAFKMLDDMNKYCLSKHGYSLSWDVSTFRKKIKMNKGKNKKIREYHNKNEIVAISKELKKRSLTSQKDLIFYHVYRLGISLGCRVGELCSLKKINFNQLERVILINSTIHTEQPGIIPLADSKLTKTKESRINQLGSLALESLKILARLSDSEFVLPNLKGSYQFMTPKQICTYFGKLLNDLKIPWIGTHGMFRKTFATQIALNSKKGHRDMIASIQAHLGHKSPQMTLHYIQAIDTNLDEELKFFDDLL